MKQMFVGMSPERINKVLADRDITDFGAFTKGDAVKYEDVRVNQKTGHEVGKLNGKWYDTKTGAEYNGQ